MEDIMFRLYTKKDCCLCKDAKEVLLELKKQYPIDVEEVDIYTNDTLIERYGISIPVLMHEEKELGSGFIHKDVIIKFILSAYKG